MRLLCTALLGLLFCGSGYSQKSEHHQLAWCSSGNVAEEGYVVTIFMRDHKTYMEAANCFTWGYRCTDTIAYFGTIEVAKLNGDYIGSNGELRFDQDENTIVFKNYDPSVTVTFKHADCHVLP